MVVGDGKPSRNGNQNVVRSRQAGVQVSLLRRNAETHPENGTPRTNLYPQNETRNENKTETAKIEWRHARIRTKRAQRMVTCSRLEIPGIGEMQTKTETENSRW